MIFKGSYVFSIIYRQFTMLFYRNFIFLSIFHVIQLLFCIFLYFLLVLHVIRWKMCIFLLFVNFPCNSMGCLQVVIFPWYSMGSLHFVIFPCYSMEIWELRRFRGGTYGRTYVRTDGRKEIHPCVLQDIGPLGLLPKKGCFRIAAFSFSPSYTPSRHNSQNRRCFKICSYTVCFFQL